MNKRSNAIIRKKAQALKFKNTDFCHGFEVYFLFSCKLMFYREPLFTELSLYIMSIKH